jgi:hypothetical protein
VVDELVQVHVLARKVVERVARQGVGPAVDALCVVEARVLARVEEAGVSLGHPELLLVVHVAHVHGARVVHFSLDLVLGHLLGLAEQGHGQGRAGNSDGTHCDDCCRN